MWNLKKGKLYCGKDTVAVRRVLVNSVSGKSDGPVRAHEARKMITLERRLLLEQLAMELGREPGAP